MLFSLQVCTRVALAAVDRASAGLGGGGASWGLEGASSGAATSGFRGGLDEGLMGGADEEEGEGNEARGGSSLGPQQSGGSGGAGAAPDLAPGGQIRRAAAPRLRTRLFAARCAYRHTKSLFSA